MAGRLGSRMPTDAQVTCFQAAARRAEVAAARRAARRAGRRCENGDAGAGKDQARPGRDEAGLAWMLA